MSANSDCRPPVLELARRITSPRDREFFTRVWSTPQNIYERRLRAVRFVDHARILDAGCGFGQWSVALARLNRSVLALDPSPVRINITEQIGQVLMLANLQTRRQALEELQDQEVYDGVFCYSAIYFTDFRQTLRRLRASLRPNGLLYLNTNGLGWYLCNFLEPNHDTTDFSSRQMAIDAFTNSLAYYATGKTVPGQCIIMPRAIVLEELRAAGFEILEVGPDGSIGRRENDPSTAFFEAEKFGLENVYEVLCQKIGRPNSG